MDNKKLKVLWVRACQVCNEALTGKTKIEDGIVYYEICLAV